jgi:hypothetical protein
MSDLTDTFYASESIHGYGTQWEIGNGASPEEFEAVPFVRKITPGAMDTADILTTHLRSPEAHHEHRPGMRDSAAFTIEMIWNPKHESQSNAGGGTGIFATGGLFFMWRTRVVKNMVLVMSDESPATELPFQGYISKCQVGEMGQDNIIPLMVEVRPTRDFSASLP